MNEVLKILYKLLYGVRWKDHIGFNNLEGVERRPVAHTPRAVLNLPATYPSFPLFGEEWNSTLSSEYWVTDFVWTLT